MLNVLVVYYSRHGGTRQLARQICRGIEEVNGVNGVLRTVPEVSAQCEQTASPVPNDGPPYVSSDDLQQCHGLALGSPTRFGNMAAPLKYWLDQTSDIWISGHLVNKPAGVFTSTASLHGGQESTLLAMMLPLIHQGMVICGIPYTESLLAQTQQGGTPYGASHWSGGAEKTTLSETEQKLARAQGRRLAELTVKLHG